MRGRLSIAAVMVMCLVAVLALPAAAHAAVQFTSEYPAATLHASPSVVAVDVFGAAQLKAGTAKITVGTTTYNATVTSSTATGHWTSSEVVSGGVYTIRWTWSNDTAGANKQSLYCFASTLATGSYNVTATVTDVNGAVLTDTWSFTIAANGTPVIPPTTATYDNTNCTTNCHRVGGSATGHTQDYISDNAMGPDCVKCHSGGSTPKHGIPQANNADAIHSALQSEINANSAGCVSCHGNHLLSVATRNGTSGSYTWTVPAIGGTTEHAGCSCHMYGEATPDKMACEDCHIKPMDPTAPYPYHVGAHSTLEAGIAGTNSSACVACHGTNVLNVNTGTTLHIANQHVGCSCHAYGEATSSNTECASCHKDAYAPHGFANGTTHTGSGGVLAGGHNSGLYNVNGATSEFGAAGVVVKSSTETTIEQQWPLPTSGVFWSQSSMTGTDSPLVAMDNRGFADAAAGAAAVRTDVGWGSTITCEDCHAGLVGVGPHGANSGKATLDPNFPDDWKTAELSTYDPTGMRSVATTVGSPNPYYTKIWDNGTTPTVTPSSGYSFGDVAGRFICQKCHKLTNHLEGYPVQNRSGRSQQGMGVSNTAHMEHHPDQIRGQANCVSCHIAVPHGWKRPRLLVYSTDDPAYAAAQPTTTTVITVNGVAAGVGNWYYGFSGTTHLDGIYAGTYTAQPMVVPGYFKELKSGDTTTNPVYTGWATDKSGVEWGAPGTETGDNEGQPNCNGCTATGSTHTPTSEGVPADQPLWK